MSLSKRKRTPYQIGVTQEYKAMEWFQSVFARYIIRSAGSHTAVDFIAGNGEDVYVVQVRYGKKPKPVNEAELREWAMMFKAIPVVMEKIRGGRWRPRFIDSSEASVP